MEQPPTPSSRNGKNLVTPKRQKKSPGDALGSGKSQVLITQYYSPGGSSSDKSSQPYSPHSFSSSVKRRIRVDSPQRKKKQRTKAAPKSQKQHIAILSSDDSLDEFEQHSHTSAKDYSPAVVSKARVNSIKRRLYPVTSSPVPSSSLKSKRKLCHWPKSRVLSDSESEEEPQMENIQPVSTLVKDAVLQSSQVPLCRRNPCPETSSQAVVISSSDESEFELHNSKQSHNFPSLSMCDDFQPSQSFLTSQNRRDSIKMGGSFLAGKLPSGTQKFLKKRCNLENSSHSGFLDSQDHPAGETPTTNGCDENISSRKHYGASLESPLPGLSNSTGEISACKNTTTQSETIDGSKNDDVTHSQVSPVQNTALSSIYFQETLPPRHNFSAILSETTEDHRRTQLNDSSSYQAATRGHSIYDEETIDPMMHHAAGSDSLPSVDVSNQTSIHGGPGCNALVHQFETTLPNGGKRGAIIEASDEDEESMIMQDQTDMRASKNNRTSLGVIPLSELLQVSHISGSDYSDFSAVHSDVDDLSIIDGSIGTYPEYSEALATHMASLLVEGSSESSPGVAPILNSVLDTSTDLFSDIVSLGTGGSSGEQDLIDDGKASGKVDSARGRSPTEELVNIALAVAELDCVSGCSNSVDIEMKSKDYRHPETEELLGQDPSLVGANASPVVDDTSRPIAKDKPSNCGKNTCTELEKTASTVEEEGKNACSTPLHSDPQSVVNPGPCESEAEAEPEHYSSKGLMAEQPAVPADFTTTSVENQIICGPQSSDNLRIIQHMEKTALQNPNKPLLLDTIISECQNFAEQVLSQEPLRSFVSQYSNLPHSTKAALHCCLIELLEDPNRWLKFSEPFVTSIDDLVSFGILEYLNKNDHLITKLNYLTSSELTDVLCKLGNSPSKSVETMRNIIVNKFSSAYTCERVKKKVTDLINRKFVKLTQSASFCIKISLELFVLPLNLCDKFYKTVDVAKFVNALIRDVSSNKILLLPLKLSRMPVNDHVLLDLSAICHLKSEVSEAGLNDESIYLRLNDICSSIAVMDISAEVDPSLRNCPTYRCLMSNQVYALDEQLKSFLYLNSSDFEFGACIYLGVLLKQNVAGFKHKVKWCRDRMRYLLKLLDSSNIFEEFYKTLKEPVSPVEFIVRSEFVSNALKIKKLGLTPEEKSHLTKLLRPISHKKTEICLVPLNNCLNYYSVLSKKPKGRNFNVVRAMIFENYKTKFPFGAEENGSLLFNAIFLTFWRVIYLNVDGIFVNKFQNCPLDWGSEDFFNKREDQIKKLAATMQMDGLPTVFKTMNCIFEQFSSSRCVVDWQLVTANVSKIQSLLEALGVDRFLKISIYVLEKLDERILGFPDMVLWNPQSKTVKFLGLKKPSDPLYAYQILWLEKLQEFDVDGEELQIVGDSASEQCSQVK